MGIYNFLFGRLDQADVLRLRLALGVAARCTLMRSSNTLVGSSLGFCGTSSPWPEYSASGDQYGF